MITLKAIPVLTVLLAIITGTVAWHKNSDALRLKEQAASLAAELASKHTLMQQQEALVTSLQTENDLFRAEVDDLRKKTNFDASLPALTENGQTDPASASSKSNAAEVSARIFDDPEMKEVIREWNSATIKEMYGDFAKDHHLSPLQSKQFFDLLTEERMRAKDEYYGLFATGEIDTGPTETKIQSWRKQKAEIDQQLRILLGNDNYAEFEEYRKIEGN